ncbi:hypothetical protein ES332_D11G405500v1 [Gossypium tomentosum]|uniref:Uncharacterized protein n=1 Tax=Gossypium tomentosum TaxID=34277 RepID=A0A5D2IY38_GOSTO|nr:hypothetical protein ES332_D11G405500v1 [Gossypium tomentosum]
MGCGMAEFEHQSMSNGSKKRNLIFVPDDLLRQERKGIRKLRELRHRRESLTKNEEEFIKSSVPEIVKELTNSYSIYFNKSASLKERTSVNLHLFILKICLSEPQNLVFISKMVLV